MVPWPRWLCVHAAEAMGVEDGGCVASRVAYLRGRSSFLVTLVSTCWEAPLRGETALCVKADT